MKKEEKLKRALNELITTESIYCRDCQAILPVTYAEVSNKNHSITDLLCPCYHIVATLHHPHLLALFLSYPDSRI